MIKKLTFLILACSLTFSASAQFKKFLKKAEEAVTGGGKLTEQEVGMGLKEALNLGVEEAVDFLHAEDGYYKSPYKILVPEEAQSVIDKLKVVPGFSNVEETLVEKMNRAAELAAEKAKPIFISAIKQMTIKDAFNILMGEKDAATRYLEGTTSDQIYDEFLPIIQTSLDEVNAREYWRNAVNAYNKIPLVKKTNPELDDHVTNKAMDGLFGLVEKKERDIRGDKSNRPTDLLKKVFEKQDK